MLKSVLTSVAALALVAGFSWRVIAAEPTAPAAKPLVATVGSPAPDFALQDQDGKEVKLSDYKDKTVVLEWFNEECPYVVKFYKEGHMNKFASSAKEKGVVWLAINSTKGKTNSDNKATAGKDGINRPILNDANGSTGHAYGATNTPHMFIVDKGTVVYNGAIDNKPTNKTADIDGATNYVAKALDELAAGKTVSESKTKPYGCSVKYAK